MSTHNIQFHNKIRKFPSVFVFLSYWKNSVRTQKWVRISLGKRGIGVRAIEVRLYSKTSMTRTPMYCLPWLVRTRFKSLGNSSDSSRKQKFRDILGFFFLFNHENVCDMYLLESPIEAIPMSTLIIPLFYRRTKQHPCGFDPRRSATFFRGDWSWNIFYGHSLPSADSRRAVVSFWRKNAYNTDAYRTTPTQLKWG